MNNIQKIWTEGTRFTWIDITANTVMIEKSHPFKKTETKNLIFTREDFDRLVEFYIKEKEKTEKR